MRKPQKQRFPLGTIYLTKGTIAALELAKRTPFGYLKRHVSGDWGDLCPEDIHENEFSLKQGFRLFSAYILPTGVKIWIITEHDRSSTTVLLPEEY